MTSRFLSVALAAMIALAPQGGAAAPQIDWNDLPDPAAQTFDDPFQTLTAEQISALRTVVRSQARQESGADRGDRKLVEARLNEAKSLLGNAGLDADELLSQRWIVAEKREQAATKGAPDLEGALVALAGFAIPAPDDEDGTPTAYLVEMRGMCSHSPPPPPNRLVRVRLGADWQPDGVHHPVRLTGTLHIDPSQASVFVLDGNVPMLATWRLDVVNAEPFEAPQPAQAASSEWVEQLRGRVSGQSNRGASD